MACAGLDLGVGHPVEVIDDFDMGKIGEACSGLWPEKRGIEHHRRLDGIPVVIDRLGA
jgi:hypothetical protein